MHLLQCMRSAQKAPVQSWKPKRHVSCHSCHHCAGGVGGELLGPRWPSARHRLASAEGRGPDSLHVPAAMPQAAADLSRLPHWYWLASSCAYAAAIMATAIWQNEAATDMGKEDMVMMTMGNEHRVGRHVLCDSRIPQLSDLGCRRPVTRCDGWHLHCHRDVARLPGQLRGEHCALHHGRHHCGRHPVHGVRPLFLYYVAAKKLEDAARPGAKPPDPKEERKARLSIAALAVDGHRPSALAGGLASGGAEVAELPPDLLATGCSVGGGAWHQSESVRHLSARAAAKRLHVFVFLVTLSLT
ncbi:unnamed protein product [Effrenium voratum]|nr:unnamed protein product [Effrenium voratum]